MKSVIAVVPGLSIKQCRTLFEPVIGAVVVLATKFDSGLPSGELVEPESLAILKKATGQPCIGFWSAKRVRELNKTANWDFVVKYTDRPYYWSARKFIEAVIRQRSPIIFVPASSGAIKKVKELRMKELYENIQKYETKNTLS